MNTIPKNTAALAVCLTWILAMSVPRPALGETKAMENAQALLEEAKTNELERKIAAKQTELSRLNEDLNKAKQQSDGLGASIEKVSAAVTESNGHLDQLAGQKKRLSEMLELVTLRIEAEKMKAEGLRMLATAQTKSLGSIAKRNEETDLRTSIASAEMSLLSPKALPIIGAADGQDSGPNRQGNPTELRKRLEKVTHATSTANTTARDAMIAASAKLQQADAAGAKAARRGSELGIDEIPELPGGKDGLDLSSTLPATGAAAGKSGVPEKKRLKH